MPFFLTPWQAPPLRPELSDQTLHIWRFPLNCTESLENLLDEQELQRAGRLRVPGKARAFIVARARLRQILGFYLGLAPEALRFDYGLYGKPALAGLPDEAPSFNLSHSGNWGLCVVSKGCAVGVDIEALGRSLDYAKLAAGFFSKSEQHWLQAGSERERRRRFFLIWTRKEAWLKGKGGGFSDSVQDLDRAHLQGCCTHAGGWWIRSFPVTRDYLAALAVTRDFPLLQRWNGWPLSN